jgi:hypothetical protein
LLLKVAVVGTSNICHCLKAGCDRFGTVVWSTLRLGANIISSIVSGERIALSPTKRTAKCDVCARFDSICSLLAEGTAEKGLVNVVLKKTDTQLTKLLPEHRKFLQGNPFTNQLG